MRLLMVNYSEVTQPGGVHTTILRVCSELAKSGWDCTVLSANTQRMEPTEFVDGVRIIRISSPLGARLWGMSPEILKYLTEMLATQPKPDIVHVHGFHTLLSPVVMRGLARTAIPVIFSPHYSPSAHDTLAGKWLSPLYEGVARVMFHHPVRIVCATEYEAKSVMSRFGVGRERIEVIPHGVSHVPTRGVRRTVQRDERLFLLYVGWLLRHKRVDVILQVLRELKDKFGKGARLVVVGSGPRGRALKRMAESLKVGDCIVWNPPVSQAALGRFYDEAGALLLFSQSENFGLVVAEALASGVPCVVVDAGGLHEYLEEPGCFGVTNPPDPAEIAVKLISISSGPIDVGPFSARIQSWQQVAQRYARLYDRLISNGRRHADE